MNSKTQKEKLNVAPVVMDKSGFWYQLEKLNVAKSSD